MPAHPPETKFYEDDKNAQLWRDLTREFEEFCGNDPQFWPRLQERFRIVIGDMMVRLNDNVKETR